MAIIITIMVLELKVPLGHDWLDLLQLWPKLLSYLISFIYVGIYWNNHHHMLQVVKKINGGVLWLNLHLLFWISLFPFVTSWAGETHFAAIPMTAYAFVALMCALAFTFLSLRLQSADPSNHLLADAVGNGRKERISLIFYVLAVILPFFGHWGVLSAGLLLIGVALIWLIPDPRIERIMTQQGK